MKPIIIETYRGEHIKISLTDLPNFLRHGPSLYGRIPNTSPARYVWLSADTPERPGETEISFL